MHAPTGTNRSIIRLIANPSPAATRSGARNQESESRFPLQQAFPPEDTLPPEINSQKSGTVFFLTPDP
jgi:hypothetical protein